HPTPNLRRQTIAEHRLHSPFVNRVERLAKQIEAAKTLELKFAEAHVRNRGGTLHVGECADRLVQHWGTGDTLATPAFASPSSAGHRRSDKSMPARSSVIAERQ